jgi:hypothetical protein
LARGRTDKAVFGLTYGLSAEKAAGYLGVSADQLEEPKASPAGGSGASNNGGG